ncbi:hypothetical protein J8F10_19795 [Gemmata sp. G18]|uniref:Uncharacterized protein n=1 Tax=Gemmata palustris TaxID=2822762 RepID=A0ABS5BUT9_9BACT|nr:hypothetical protein [Gemmata palustris]MBP3957497.1 hypothetical protein [Gemmata palustris]
MGVELLGCGGVLIGVLVGLLIGAVILRLAVSFANRIIGPVKPPDTFGQWDDWDSDEPAPKARTHPDRVIPEPGFATGMLTTFLTGIVDVCCYGFVVFIKYSVFDDLGGPDEWVPFALIFFCLPASYLALTALLTSLLPTTLRRAALVAFLNYAATLVIALIAGVAVLLAWSAVGP